jgi:hypothetical protein
MDNKKYEQLINLIINEDEEQARELFHEIVVEKSREIYESIMEEEMVDEGDMGDMGDDMEEGMGGQVGDLLDEINAEESGVTEEEEEEVFDLDSEEEDFGGDEGEASDEVEDAVIRIEDKLDQLMAEFEEIMGGGDAELDAGDDGEEEVEVDSEEEEAMMEAVQLQKVSVTHGDDGVQKKSPVAANSGKAGMDSKPVNFGGADEKGRTAPSVKDVEGASKFKNAPGHKSQDLSNAPKPVTKDGAAYDKSPVAK